MIEKLKTGLLVMLVALSLFQSYLLAYSMPGLGATVRSEGDYVNADPLGTPSSAEAVIFPEELVLHMGNDVHTVIYPGTQFYDMILKQRIVGREFKGFQRSSSELFDWDKVRRNDIGIELVFGGGISVDLLQKLLKLEGDMLFLQEKIDRIWIFKTEGAEEIRTFFFSSDGQMVYESVRADLTVRDVQDYVGFGQYLPTYRMTDDGLYIPDGPIRAIELVYQYDKYTPEQMQRLFFDPSTTRVFEDRSGSQIFTDGKRGLKVEQNGMWINYTNPAAVSSSETRPSENVYASIDFINQHGGWDGVHSLVSQAPDKEKKYVMFRKYLEQYPVIDFLPFRYGYIRLTLQQGVVTEYGRSLIELNSTAESRNLRWLPGGEGIEGRLERYARRDEVTLLFPALKAVPIDEGRLQFVPVWAVRLADGSEEVLLEAFPVGYTPPDIPETAPEDEGPAQDADGEAGEDAAAGSGENGQGQVTAGGSVSSGSGGAGNASPESEEPAGSEALESDSDGAEHVPGEDSLHEPHEPSEGAADSEAEDEAAGE